MLADMSWTHQSGVPVKRTKDCVSKFERLHVDAPHIQLKQTYEKSFGMV